LPSWSNFFLKFVERIGVDARRLFPFNLKHKPPTVAFVRDELRSLEATGRNLAVRLRSIVPDFKTFGRVELR
jgi:hypothetical protein